MGLSGEEMPISLTNSHARFLIPHSLVPGRPRPRPRPPCPSHFALISQRANNSLLRPIHVLQLLNKLIHIIPSFDLERGNHRFQPFLLHLLPLLDLWLSSCRCRLR